MKKTNKALIDYINMVSELSYLDFENDDLI